MPLNAIKRMYVGQIEDLSQQWRELCQAFPQGKEITLSQSDAELFLAFAATYFTYLLSGQGGCRRIVALHLELLRFANKQVEGADIGGALPDDDYPDPAFQDRGNKLLAESHKVWQYLYVLGEAIDEVAKLPLSQQTATNIRAAFLRGIDWNRAMTPKYNLDLERDFGF